MKAYLLSFLLLTLHTVQAQTFAEWFAQKKTQRNYLVQQIAALQAYTGTLRQGYAVARQGISAVQQIKKGDLGLHQAFFGSLQQVNTALRHSPRVTDILTFQAALVGDFRQALPALRAQGQLTAPELGYLEAVRQRVLASCARDLDALAQLLAPGALQLTDDQRWRQLEALHTRMRDAYRFTQSFLNEARLLSLQRARDRGELKRTHLLFQLP